MAVMLRTLPERNWCLLLHLYKSYTSQETKRLMSVAKHVLGPLQASERRINPVMIKGSYCRNRSTLHFDKLSELPLFTSCRNLSLSSSFSSVSTTAVTTETGAKLTSDSSLLFPDFPIIRAAETVIQKLHDVTGLPWWAAIVLTAVTLRMLLVMPLSIYSLRNVEKLQTLEPHVKEISKQLKVEVAMAMHQFKWDEKKAKEEYIKNMNRLVRQQHIQHNCHPMKNTASFWLQTPLWISVSYSLRNLSSRAVDSHLENHEACEGLTREGTLWFTDLTVCDTTWTLPICMGAVTLFNVEMSRVNVGEMTKYKKRLTYFLRALASMFIPISSTMPSAMVLYWVTSGSMAAAQTLLLQKSSTFRRLVSLPPIPQQEQKS